MAEKGVTELLYSPLPETLQERVFGATQSAVDSDSKEQAVKAYLSSVLPATDTKRINGELKKRLLLAKHRLKGHKRSQRQKKSQLTLSEKRELGLHKLNKSGLKYSDFCPLHSLWKQYFSSYIDISFLKESGFTAEPTDKHWDHVSRLLMKADYHGCLLTVTRSRCPSLVGKQGLVVLETKNTFQLVTIENRLLIVPKMNSIFTFTLSSFTFTIYGKHFCIRPSERSAKKIKSFLLPDL
ncbi:ribonuclease P protein subunit p29 [Schistocerca gregaria]|uniref:ribonuclease P protein subunit p29 n=1 Tax=Schistocerca gregaria TaxID=7010 RepID=UPI00211DAAAD|nr:ribonuclease P protein subunit p29 [Schistocerca gregaria]